MKFEELTDLNKTTLMKVDTIFPCEVCGKPTQFIDYCYEMRLCSSECEDEFLKDLNHIHVLRKWDFKLEKYLPYEIPVNWNIALCEVDMNTVIDCAGCGKSIPYGESYTSRTIHTDVGLGYALCEDCYEKELDEEKQYK